MRLLHWNVNGLRSICKKQIKDGLTFKQFISKYDIIVLNETKMNSEHVSEIQSVFPQHYYCYHDFALKKGYSGVSIVSREQPLQRLYPPFKDDEGRVVILEYNKFILIGVYVPNSGTKSDTGMPKRITYRTRTWDPQFQMLCSKLEKKKPIIVLGDLNVAFTEMDLAHPSKNRTHAGFTDGERHNFGILLETTRLMDVWRYRHPSKIQYTYFDYRSRARQRNAGWRIDYALLSKELIDIVKECNILDEIVGSDHVPIELILTCGF